MTEHKDRLGSVETHVAIQGVCAWPNLTQFADGTIVATIFNQPTHGRCEGDTDCWASTDGGEIWSFRGQPCPHEPGTSRMNYSAGLAAGGDMIVMCSGLDKRVKLSEATQDMGKPNPLQAWVCRSSDQARTWQWTGELPDPPAGAAGGCPLIPFGKAVVAEDGSMRTTVYTQMSGENRWCAFMLVSRDEGCRWEILAPIANGGLETDILPVRGGRWLAATRTLARELDLYVSGDDGKTWRLSGPLGLPWQIPGHLLRLSSGRIVVTYGNRCLNNFGIDARISDDEGATWRYPFRLANMLDGDGGYPSSVQRADGRIVTAFYNKISGAFHYEMSVAAWSTDDYEKPK